jgi:glucose/mannose-6-phosphate isomerase
MKDLIKDFGRHISAALEIAQNTELRVYEGKIEQVLITGLGGSGIGGSAAVDLLSASCKVPVLVNKGYALPAYAGPGTLLLASSYSGNTEETVAVFEAARRQGCEIACITSGGKLGDMAAQKGLNTYLMPGGNPPRSMFGYSFTLLLAMLAHYRIADSALLDEAALSVELLDREDEGIRNKARALADHLYKKIPVIYSADGYEGVAVRFRQQVNENGKMLCWHHVIPEMNHNELVGWAGGDDRMAVVFFRNSTDDPRNQKRMEINQEIIRRQTDQIMEIWSEGNSQLQRTYYLVHLGDWCSLYLSELNKVDVVEVKVIDYLKSELAKN